MLNTPIKQGVDMLNFLRRSAISPETQCTRLADHIDAVFGARDDLKGSPETEVSFQKDAPGYQKGKPTKADHMKVSVSAGFIKANNKSGLVDDIQREAVSFLQKRGYNPKGYAPLVSTAARAPS
jgi:hypothetical protein